MKIVTPLAALSANPETVSVSGFSLGAYMAIDLGCVYSKLIKGVAFMGSGPYHNDRGEEGSSLSQFYIDNKTP